MARKFNGLICYTRFIAKEQLDDMAFSVSDSHNNSCEQNVSTEAVKLGALMIGAPGIACFGLNLVGLASELIYVCLKKNTFLLRLFVYLSVAVTMSVGGYSSFILMYFWPEIEYLCQTTHTLLQYSAAVELSLVFSINVILLCKVCSSFGSSSWKRVLPVLSKSKWKYFEVLFVLLNFGIPAIALATFLGIVQEAGVCFTVKHSLKCYIEESYILIGLLIFELIPVLLDSFLSVLCIGVLMIWLCWLRNRLILKAQMKTVVKEIGAWLGFLVVYCVVGIVIEISNFTDNAIVKFIAFVSYPILHSSIPFLFFGYMCVIQCPCCNKKKLVPIKGRAFIKKNLLTDTNGLQTTPPSTRVSLPSDTAAHAPNFLSPIGEDSTEVSPLLV